MKKTLLSNIKKTVIRDFCREQFEKLVRAELKMDKSDEAMKAYLIKRVEEEFPRAEMLILQKHDVVRSCDCIQFVLDHSREDRSEFEIGDFLSPKSYSCHTINVTGKVASTWFEKKAEFKKRITEKRSAYNSLINTARYFEDVVSVLPIVESLRETICGVCTAVTTLNEDTKAVLTADNKAIEKLVAKQAAND